MKQRELSQAKETILNFEDVISKKESELIELKNILDESEKHSKLNDMKKRIDELESDLNILIEDKTSMEQDIESKNIHIDYIQKELERTNSLLEQNSTATNYAEENNKEMLKKIQELEEVIESRSIEIVEEE